MSREFDYSPAVRSTLPLLLGVAGPTGSGKTYSALRLATGMQRVTPGDIALIDTEAKRATAYDRHFKFMHLDFAPPFGPIDYQEAIEHVIGKGAKHIIVDSMTHEHSGPGGVMDKVNAFLDKNCGSDFAKRDRMNMLAHKGPKGERKTLNNYVVQAGRGGVNFIFCYRADEKVKPVQGQGIQNIGMTPETTSKLVYEMMAMFLLSPAADGKPITNPQTQTEKVFTKLPIQFRDMLAEGQPLSEDFGQKLCEWAKGSVPKDAEKRTSEPPLKPKVEARPMTDSIKKSLLDATKDMDEAEGKTHTLNLMEKYFSTRKWSDICAMPDKDLDGPLLKMKASEGLS